MTVIPLSSDDADTYDSPHDYGGVPVQGGHGIVLGKDSYTTSFVECFPSGAFIRGEGATVAKADEACWAKLQAYLACPRHEWEARDYRNGAGICRLCGQFAVGVFTPEQLDMACTVCLAPTFHTMPDGSNEVRCTGHDPFWPYHRASMAAMRRRRESDLAQSMYRRLTAVAEGEAPLDPEALAWARENLPLEEA